MIASMGMGVGAVIAHARRFGFRACGMCSRLCVCWGKAPPSRGCASSRCGGLAWTIFLSQQYGGAASLVLNSCISVCNRLKHLLQPGCGKILLAPCTNFIKCRPKGYAWAVALPAWLSSCTTNWQLSTGWIVCLMRAICCKVCTYEISALICSQFETSALGLPTYTSQGRWVRPGWDLESPTITLLL